MRTNSVFVECMKSSKPEHCTTSWSRSVVGQCFAIHCNSCLAKAPLSTSICPRIKTGVNPSKFLKDRMMCNLLRPPLSCVGWQFRSIMKYYELYEEKVWGSFGLGCLLRSCIIRWQSSMSVLALICLWIARRSLVLRSSTISQGMSWWKLLLCAEIQWVRNFRSGSPILDAASKECGAYPKCILLFPSSLFQNLPASSIFVLESLQTPMSLNVWDHFSDTAMW